MGVKHIIGLVGIVIIFVLVGIVYDLQTRTDSGKNSEQLEKPPAGNNTDIKVVQGTVPNPPPVPVLPNDEPSETPQVQNPDNSAAPVIKAVETPSNASGTAENTPQPAVNAPDNGQRTYVVQPRDTLHSIARKMYGDSSKWKLIYNANTHIIKNPDQVERGWQLTIPAAGTQQAPATTQKVAGSAPRPIQAGYEYTVKPGDTLESIAEKILKDKNKADTIYLLNKDRIPQSKQLTPGLILEVPRMNAGN